MKRLLLSIMTMILTNAMSWAGPAFRQPYTVTQPDGTQLELVLNGDEHKAWLTTTDGTLIVEQAKAYYVAAVTDDGRLEASEALAHQSHQRSIAEQLVCEAQQMRRSLFFEQAEAIQVQARRAQVTSATYFPHTGSPRCLVILANFKDKQFLSEDPVAQFTQYFMGETQENLGNNEQKNFVSVRKYFEQSSHGKFTPQFDVVGPVTLPETLEYYGKNSSDPGTDVFFNQFCKQALTAADSIVDFKLYDNNGDNRVELVCIIYAGYGESVSGNPAETIWPKCAPNGSSTNDGVTVTYCNCSPELMTTREGRETDINGIGLFCHEFSHGMGLPDLYPTNESARMNNQTPEFFDLMDYGEYAWNGYAPVPYTAWEQEAMGWLDVEVLTESRTNIELKPLVQGGKAYKFGNGANSEEWIMLENVQTRDTNNKTLGFQYGHGLLAWHVAYSNSTVNMADYPNNKAGTPRVCIIPADGLVINGYLFGSGQPYSQTDYTNSLKGDPFPGTSEVTTLTAEQGLPNYKFYNGEEKPLCSLKNIREAADGTITFDFDNGVLAAIQTIEQRTEADAYYTLDGRRIEGKPLRSGLYIHNGKTLVVK